MISIIFFFVLLFTGNIQTGVIQSFSSSNINMTEPLVIYNNETLLNGNQSSINTVDQNQFAETVVDLLLDLLEKANLSRTVSVIHNDTELSDLVEQNGNSKTATIKLSNP